VARPKPPWREPSRGSPRSSRTRSRPPREPRITAYATELATTFHAFYRDARVVDPDAPERSTARLGLAEAARVTLANALGLLGISAPESM
jgi:arginyl-tRNA synthetase